MRNLSEEIGMRRILSWLKGKGDTQIESQIETEKTEEFEGFTIKPSPQKQQNGYATAGYISKPDNSGGIREHFFIRADTHADFEEACQHSIFKAKQIIKESGERVFDKSR